MEDEEISESPATKPENRLFYIVEKMPTFNGNNKLLEKFITNNLRYPDKARESGIEGTVYIELVINIDGSVIDIKVLRGVLPELDNEAIRLIKLTNKMWTPGKQQGKKVKVRKVLPIKFTLS